MKKKQFWIVIVILLFALSRLSYIFLLKPSDIGSNLKIIESQYIGLVAKHLIEGRIMPFWDYQFSSYDGGTLLAGIALVPFFAIFGQTSFALSFYAFVTSLAAFLVWWRFTYIYFGERVASITALLFVFAPPIHIKANGVASGNHMEISLFVALVVFLFYKNFFVFPRAGGPARKPNIPHLMLLGFISGLGVYFCYSLGILLLTCVLFWITIDKKPYKIYHYGILCGAGLLGCSFILPRLPAFNSLIVADIFTQWPLSNLSQFGIRLIGVVTRQIPMLISLWSPLHLMTYAVFMASLFYLTIKNRASLKNQLLILFNPRSPRAIFDDSLKDNLLLMFPVLYILIYTLSNFNTYAEFESPIRHRYLLLLYPFIFIIMAIGMDHLYRWKNPWGKKMAVFLLFYSVAASVYASWNQIEFKEARKKVARRLTEKGFSYEMLGAVICARFGGNPDKSLSLLNHVKPPYTQDTYKGFGYEFAMMQYLQFNDYKELMPGSPYKTAFLKGYKLGETAQRYFKGTDAGRAYLVDVMGHDVCQEPDVLGDSLLSLIAPVRVEDKSPYYKGIGMILALQCDILTDVEFNFIKKIDSKYYQAFYEGVAEGRRYNLNISSDVRTP